jgi:riboflavin kinase/FMN adenylyltransferase
MTFSANFRRIGADAPLPTPLRSGVVAIGNFDGVHRGHQAVLEQAISQARRDNAPVFALTFTPHPRQVFRPDLPHFVLTPPAMKARMMAMLGLDGVVEIAFDRAFASLSAQDFVTQVLVDRLGASHCLTGFDFHFGKDRTGNPDFLAAAGERHGFAVTLIDAYCDEGAGVISSSRIRAALERGDLGEANGMLGYRYTVEGEILHGQKLGRTLGFPTANMELPDSGLRHGVYAVRLRRADGSLHDGVASFGRRPTVTDDGAPLLETYVFDFNDDLYAEICQVSLFAFLRGEAKFASLDNLVFQMKRDEEEARAVLSDARPLSPLDARIAFEL